MFHTIKIVEIVFILQIKKSLASCCVCNYFDAATQNIYIYLITIRYWQLENFM